MNRTTTQSARTQRSGLICVRFATVCTVAMLAVLLGAFFQASAEVSLEWREAKPAQAEVNSPVEWAIETKSPWIDPSSRSAES
jgi:hypothetical protein